LIKSPYSERDDLVFSCC